MSIIKSKIPFIFLTLILSATLGNPAFGAGKETGLAAGLVAPGASLKMVQTGFSFTEGPAADADGNIYFVDIPKSRIYKWTWANGKITLYRANTGQANGMMFDAKGRLVICEMQNHRVTRDDMKGHITVLADAYHGKKLHMPNDLWIDSKGGIYFSDFTGPGASGAGGLQVYYIPPGGGPLRQATHDLIAPNGLIGTPDNKILYITDPGAKKTYSYKINPDGSLTDKKLFCNQFTDGFKLDEKGNLYFSGDKGVTIYSPKGVKIGEIPMPQRCENLTFGGKDRKTLFIAAGKSVYTLKMAVRGAPTALDLAMGRNSLVAPGSTIKTVQSGFNGTEGPAADADGNIYFTEKGGNSIQKWTWKTGKVSLYRKIHGGAIGMAFDARGRLLICEMGNGRVVRDDMKGGKLQVIADSCDGKKIHIPNDIWADPKGGVYFSDFSFANMHFPAGGTAGGGRPGGAPGNMPPGMNEKISPGDLGIDYIAPDGKVTRVANLNNPNGLIGTPDGKTLYATGKSKIWSYTIGPKGTLSNKKVFCNQSTDGMALDERGDLYLIGDYLTVYNPKGEEIAQIVLPEKNCKNMTFGGKDRNTLFIAGNVAVYTLKMSVRGAPTALDLARGND